MKTQNRSLDAWKGLAIVAVVGIHACNDAMLFPTDSANYQVGLVLRAVFNYAVALFFAVSGFLPFTLWIVFYYLGFAVRGGLLSMSRPKLLTLVAIGFVLSLAESVGVSYYLVNGSFAPSQAKFSTFAYAAAVSLLALSGTLPISRAIDWRSSS